MKKKITILSLVFLMALILTAFAAGTDLYLVADGADILTSQEWSALNSRAEEISTKYQCDVAIVTISGMDDNSGIDEWAMYIYEKYAFGYGADKSGVLLLLSMAERSYALIAHGYGNTAFTDHGKNVMLDQYILPLLGDDKYYEAFSAYLDKAEEYLSMARGGSPFDIDTDVELLAQQARASLNLKLAVTILLPLLIAFAVCAVWKSQMKTAKLAKTADQYIPAGGFRLTVQEDTFLYRTETRVKIEKSSSSGGTTTNSRGYSGRSGKF